MQVQAALGSDIVMVFDECAPGEATHEVARTSMELTSRWAERSRRDFDRLQREGMDTGRLEPRDGLTGAQALFGIIQGAAHLDLRKESLARTVEIGFDGYAIGGLSVGEEKSVMYSVIEELTPVMPEESPRYLMGVGTPEDLVEAVARGVDMFDCVLPTRLARHHTAITREGNLNLLNARFKNDQAPIDENI
jgi:queuine tRNA-ribosyltransferase